VVAILTGPVGGGKTTLLEWVVVRLKEHRISFDGYLSQRVLDGENVNGYDLLDLRSGRRHSFLRREGSPEWPRVGQYTMNPDGLAAAEKILGRGLFSDLMILDELGRLELEGKGVWPAARPILTDDRRESLVVIRETLLDSYLTGPLADHPGRMIVCSKSLEPGALIQDLLSPWIPRLDITGSDERP